jgi:alkanesulfonate monooxygenase SsuD/methylene tetrahydromethanopterin reductase-like flavin-dependent oxidoreductase (luciferase family)
MKFGVAIFPTDAVQPPGEIARMAEERGFECLLFPEHTHIPAGRIGVDRVVFWLPPESPDAVEEGFGRYVSAMGEFRRAG